MESASTAGLDRTRRETVVPIARSGRGELVDIVNDHEKSAVSIMEIPHPWVIEIGL